MKKILSFALTILMLSGMLVIPAQADNSGVLVQGEPYPSVFSKETSDSLRNAFSDAIDNLTSTVDISKYNINVNNAYAVSNILINLVFDNPLYFYVDYTDIDFYSMPATGQLVLYKINYLYNADTLAARMKEFNAAADEAVYYVSSRNPKNDFDKALLLHDYIVSTCEYDSVHAAVYTTVGHGADNMLIEKTGYCQAYAAVYKYLAQRLGLECTAAYSNTDNHQWVMLKLNGNWYHVDPTYDDPLKDRLGYVSHDMFLLTDDEIVKYDHHSDWFSENGASATDTSYKNASWRGAVSSVVFINDNRYYIKENYDSSGLYESASIVKCDSSMNVTGSIYTFSEKWHNPSNSSFYTGSFSGLSEFENELYFNTGSVIMKLNPLSDNPTAETVYTYTPSHSAYASGTYLFGSYEEQGILYFAEANYEGSSVSGTDSSTKQGLKLYSYKVSFNTNGGTSVHTQYLGSGKTVSPVTTTKDGSTLVGWYTDSDFTNEWDMSAVVTSDMTLYAKWSEPIEITSNNLKIENGTVCGSVSAKLNVSVSDPKIYLTIAENGVTKYHAEISGSTAEFSDINIPYTEGARYVYGVCGGDDASGYVSAGGFVD